MTAHNADHQRILQEILVSGADARVAFAASQLAGCTECARLIDGLSRAAALLDDLHADFRRTADAAAQVSQVPGLEHVEGVLGRRLRPTRRRPPFAAIASGVLALAAGVCFLLYWLAGPPVLPQRALLGNASGVRLLQPVGASSDFARFDWAADERALAAGFTFELRVYACGADGRATGEPLALHPRAQGTSWTPTPDVRASFPEAIVWELRVFDGSAGYVETLSAQARSSP